MNPIEQRKGLLLAYLISHIMPILKKYKKTCPTPKSGIE